MLSVQKIMNIIYGTSNLSLQQIFNRVYEAGGFLPTEPVITNTRSILAGESMAAAVTAAVADGASATNPFRINKGIGAIEDRTTADPPGIIIVDESYPTELFKPKPIKLHAKGGIGCCVDDGINRGATATLASGWWYTANAALDNHTPLNYTKKKGVFLTHAVITNTMTNGSNDRFTAAQVADLIQTYGHDIACHSSTHNSYSSLTAAEIETEIVASKTVLETAINGAIPSLNYVCESFVSPGTHTGAAYPNTLANLDNAVGRAIRANYKGHRLYDSHNFASPYQISGFAQFAAANDASEITSILAAIAATGTATTIFFHEVVNSGATGQQINVATFKTIIDAISDANIAGEVASVTLRTLHKDYELCHGMAGKQWPGMAWSNLDFSTINQRSRAISANTTEVNSVPAASLVTVGSAGTYPNAIHPGYFPTKAYKINFVDSAIAEPRRIIIKLRGTETCGWFNISFDIRQITAGDAQTFQIRAEMKDVNYSPNMYALDSPIFPIANDWETVCATLYIPKDLNILEFSIYGKDVSTAASGLSGKGYLLCNPMIQRVA